MTKKILKIAGIGLLLVVLAIGGLLAYVKTALPNIGPAPELKVTATTAQIERGRYLANHVTVCIDCHSERDWSKYSGPPVAGTFGKGGDKFGPELGFPGTYYAKNITPAGLGNWTDGEIFRAITTGVNKDGEALFPVMPYHNYGKMAKEDLEAIIAYLRTLQPIEHKVPESESDFPMNFIINTLPAEAELQPLPNRTDEIAYGKYLVTAASCLECHAKQEKGTLVPGSEFGGGSEFNFPDGTIVRSANISPNPVYGIGKWNRETFINRFKMHATEDQPMAEGAVNTVMPWKMYAGMTNEDLGAIYAYLQTVPQKDTKIERYTKPTQATAALK